VNLPVELSEVIVAALIIAISLFAWALAVLRSAPGDRAPVWFGLFGCLYGIRLAARSSVPSCPVSFRRFGASALPPATCP
jgi:hypothetical protein